MEQLSLFEKQATNSEKFYTLYKKLERFERMSKSFFGQQNELRKEIEALEIELENVYESNLKRIWEKETISC